MISMSTKRIFVTFLEAEEKFAHLLSFFPKLIESLTTAAILEVATDANIIVKENLIDRMESCSKPQYNHMESVGFGKLNKFVGELLLLHLSIIVFCIREISGLLIT